tara:strand:- start:244 stop:780 length:537 start_codon:yes stop_codon:yes gene_type:complete
MAFQLSDGTGLPIDVPFTIGSINYPANWLRLSTAEEKTALGIKEVADPKNYDSRFYMTDGTEKALDDADAKDKDGNLVKDANGNQVVILGVKSILKNTEKSIAGSLLGQYDWYVTRKAEKGTEIPSAITTYRDAVRTACNTRETEIDNCADTSALVNLFEYKEDGTPNITQYPTKPNV